MTAQCPDKLINEHPRVDLANLDLYFILRRNVNGKRERVDLPVPPAIPKNNSTNSGLWRGYVATFCLESSGTLKLLAYDFPYAQCAPSQTVTNGMLTGDFWLVMRQFFSGPSTRIPFRDGHIIENKSEWDIEDQTLNGHVTGRLKDSGLLVDIDEMLCFLPRSFLPIELRDDLDALIGRALTCEIFQMDGQRRCVIVRLINFLPAK